MKGAGTAFTRSESSNGAQAGAAFIRGGGAAGALIRGVDWRTTRLGAAEEWPQSLRTALNLCVNSRFPIALYWGAEFVMLYNDSLLPMVGANKHPQAMGRPAFEVLPEIRGIIEPLLEHVRTTGEATWSEDLMLPLVRGAAPEESYFTFTYSPIHDESGDVGGVFCAVIETTDKVIEDRRLRLLNALAEAAREKTKQDACARAAERIAQFPQDVPFALLYLLDEGSRVATLAGAANIAPGTPRAPVSLEAGAGSIWPYYDGQLSDGVRLVELDDGPQGARAVVILPIERSGGGPPLGFLVAGLSPMLSKSPSYDRFHNLLASSLSQAVANAAAYADERRRAEALAELDRVKTKFFSNVSHEFRTPLTLMLAPIQDMLATPDGAPVDRQSLELLHRNAVRLLKLVNTLLEFSRIEAGRVEAVYEPVDLAALTVDLTSSFRAAVERAGLALVVDCAALGEPIYVDRDMWEKIVLNLLSNAFKFTFEGSITVRLELDEGGACLRVTDTGTGIPEHELARLFERFHRIEGARARSHEGSGIGLALIQELVRLHGGDIRVTSRLGYGTTFRICVPRGSAHLPPSRIRAPRILPPTAIGAQAYAEEAARWEGAVVASRSSMTRTMATRERIIFADDNADMRDYITRLLGERWTVEAFSDGATALERARSAPPDLILSDVMMPGLDGFGFVHAVRADAALRATPIILLSARASEEEAAHGLGTGANDYIAKPFSARELLVRVTSNLAAARSARELAAVEHKQRENLYRHFMQAPFPVAVFKGAEHVIELANPSTLRAFGKSDEIIGMPLADALPAIRDQPFLGYLDEVYRTGVAHHGREYPARLPTGAGGELEEAYFDFVHAPLRDPHGAIEGVLLSAFDVTAQVRARQEMENAMELLTQVTTERQHALEEAQRASLAKDEFLATISHELRTPLNAIIGWSSLLQNRTVSGSQVPKALEIIERNARMQARLIEDMLDVARIEQGKLVLSVAPTDMVRVVESALDAVRHAAELKGVRLERALDATATLVGDADRLQQVVWNLLSNAIKFTPKGGRVQALLRREESHVEFAVADEGQGIDPSFLPHVFERFRQADGTISRKTGGLGLGLAIVRSVVELHGGTVTAQSPGLEQGSTFIVCIPTAGVSFDKVEPISSGELATARAASFERPPSLAGLRVLVVDDENEVRDLLQYILEQCGCVVCLANGAESAFDALRRGTYDVLISDIGMPENDGYGLIRRIRERPGSHRIAAIALTGYARGEDRAAALRAGFDMHLTKPAQPDDLVAAIASLVQRSEAR